MSTSPASAPSSLKLLRLCISPTLLLSLAAAQSGPTATPQQAPRTAPQVMATLPSYEGQNVTTVELAGQPGLRFADYEPLLAQKPGTPFTRAKVDQTIAALQRGGRFHAVELE